MSTKRIGKEVLTSSCQQVMTPTYSLCKDNKNNLKKQIKMAIFPTQYINVRGIPTIKTRAVVVSDTAVTFKFAPDFDGRPFRGLILVYISEAIPEGTTTTLPVQFSMAGTTSNVTVAGGANVTVADLPGKGIYLVYFDRWADTLQLIGLV